MQLTNKEKNDVVKDFLAREDLDEHEAELKARFNTINARGQAAAAELEKLRHVIADLEHDLTGLEAQGNLVVDLIVSAQSRLKTEDTE